MDDYCYKAADKMVTDAKFYGENLRAVAGVLVPRHYGVWRAQTRWGGAVLCSITEWAGTSWTQLVAAGSNTPDLKYFQPLSQRFEVRAYSCAI